MRNLAVIFVLILMVLISTTAADRGVRIALSVYQDDSLSQRHEMLYVDTVDVVESWGTVGFLVLFSIEIQLSKIDSSRTSMNVHLVTLGPRARTYARTFTIDYGLPARIDKIEGKEGSIYSLEIVPIESIDVDTTACPPNPRTKNTYRFTPSANMDIYFVPASLGDFYWNSVKGLLEEEHRFFKKKFHLSLPGKYRLFMSPCVNASLLWDKRFGTVVDPTRNTVYTIYSKELNSTDPFVINYAALLRTFGYAPPLLGEGFAGYYSGALFDMKSIVADGRAVGLAELMGSLDFYQTDPVTADRSAATFVAFLIDEFGTDKFLDVYRQSHDFNITATLTQAYGLSINELENRWLNFVDTVKVSMADLNRLADRAETMLNYREMKRYSEAMVLASRTSADSLRSLPILKRACFFLGDYYQATEIQKSLLSFEENAGGFMTLATYKMMNGYNDEARQELNTALAMDPANQFVKFNLALNLKVSGERQAAIKSFTDIIVNPIDGSALGESRIMLAHLLLDADADEQSAQIITYLNEGTQAFEQLLRSHIASPAAEMWAGIGYLGLEDTDNAIVHLETALFLETRAFYQGMITLWLGKAMDMLSEREAARNYYGQVLSLSSAAYHQEEARGFLEKPYRQ